MKRASLIALGGLAVVVTGVYGLSQTEGGLEGIWRTATATEGPALAAPVTTASAPKQGAPVETAKARSIPAMTELQSVGSLSSDESVSVAAEIAGRIASIGAREGEAVKTGDTLVQLDDALARAEMANVEANLRLAQSNYDRATTLTRSGAGTERARDEALAALETGRAAVELARVRLDKMNIRAPFDGTVGIRTVSVGAYAQIGQALMNLEKIDTLKLDFRLPEINLRDVHVGQTVLITVDAYPGQTYEGQVYAIDPLLDVNGRALKIRARLQNPGNRLRPGLFARVTVTGASRGNVVVVPEGAIVPRGNDVFVYRVEGGKALESKVKLGERRAGQVEVVEGLTADSMVVVAGQGRLRDGAVVEVIAAAAEPS
ncbi:efflux RND transporter periplasmic adaptor subunit [Flaviflagellibacter deserti]|uniref:Efflux RND transporter periplasmic adaptor subunit n=1 Tax=Flaviflagellibacter deserti TaxID=2267266 RepID=A0ABV9Z1E3_9HYPH